MPICGTALGARLYIYEITLDVRLCVRCTRPRVKYTLPRVKYTPPRYFAEIYTCEAYSCETRIAYEVCRPMC